MLACGSAAPLGWAEELPAPAPSTTADEATARRVIDDAIDRASQQRTLPPQGSASAPGIATSDNLLLARLSAEVAAKQLEAKRLSQKSPSDALDLLDATAKSLDAQPLPEETKT
ncbi:MAG: hypothetical protein WD060_02165, partial [Pirellulales bacterium]